MNLQRFSCFVALCMAFSGLRAQAPKSPAPPIMGWSSWNNFRVHIDEQMIREQADALVASGMYEAGYRFINIDDGYFGGRDTTGMLFVDAVKFPSGMGALIEYIHGKGLKAGIYTDAGKNTCGSIYDRDTNGIGVGIYGHLEQDCNLFFREWKADFLKVDWCGGEQLKLNEEVEYTKIIRAVKSTNPNAVFNICRWQFPGIWATTQADSWRISGDIEARFESILRIIDLNAPLYPYASPGHYNDMDMLQVGRGMSFEEDKAHFSMWCMLNSPLLAGNDLRNMTTETVEILTNKEVIALNQDTAFVQARKILTVQDIELWIKPLAAKAHKMKAVAILNRGSESAVFQLTPKILGISKKSTLRDLWLHKSMGKLGNGYSVTIPKHGIVVLKIEEPKAE